MSTVIRNFMETAKFYHECALSEDSEQRKRFFYKYRRKYECLVSKQLGYTWTVDMGVEDDLCSRDSKSG